MDATTPRDIFQSQVVVFVEIERLFLRCQKKSCAGKRDTKKRLEKKTIDDDL